LPQIGAFSLVADIVSELRHVNERQDDLERRQDLHSKRAYHSNARALGLSYEKTDDSDNKSIHDQWGGAEKFQFSGGSKQLRMIKGMCHTGTDRFNTSTRAWLKNVPNRNDERDKPPTQRMIGQMMSTG